MPSVRGIFLGLGMVALAAGSAPARADLSACVATVGFGDKANLARSPGVGLRWGASSRLVGGETSLLVTRPERRVEVPGQGVVKETATALFYEGRLLVNIPAGQLKPFVGVGLGAVTVTATDLTVPAGSSETVVKALDTISELQTNTSLSYGGGLRYAFSPRLDVRADARRYVVLSVRGLAARELENQTGVEVPGDKDTVTYDELSLGVSFAF
ncbi:MAG: outer membrane beta-barrel protein [Candidatus Latescibacterota bacterium]